LIHYKSDIPQFHYLTSDFGIGIAIAIGICNRGNGVNIIADVFFDPDTDPDFWRGKILA